MLVDCLSKFTVATAFSSKKMDVIARKTVSLLHDMKDAGVPVGKGTKLFADSGSEWIGIRGDGAENTFTKQITAFGVDVRFLPPRHPAVFVESRNNNIRTNINSRLAAKKSKKWVSIYKGIVGALNKAALTPPVYNALSPLDIIKLSVPE